MERVQADLVDFSKKKSVNHGKTYSYVLAVIDVFSRYLWLWPQVTKESKEIVPHLEKLFNVFGRPKITQTDQGSEFKGT